MIPRIAVVGGGISGLACAYRLQELLPGASIHVLEAQNRIGGLLETLEKDGFTLEGAPDCYLADRPFIASWLAKTGLSDAAIGTQTSKRGSFILKNGRLTPIPKGFYMISPTSFKALLRTNLSFLGKLRMACEYFLPARREKEDESVADFITRRFGREALEQIGQPMVAGIYTADPERLSFRAAMPRFHEMEQEHGSIIRALGARRSTAERDASGPRYSLFQSMRGGMEQMITGLASKLGKVRIRTAFPVKRIEKMQCWKIFGENGEVLEADAVCLALPSYKSAELLAPFLPEVAAELEKIVYEPVATLNFAYDAASIPELPEGFGVVVPAAEKRNIVGMTFSSLKFEGRSPQGKILIRVFVGGAFQHDVLNWSDAEIQSMVREELKEILKIEAVPLFCVLRRYPRAMPQYHVGHLERVKKIFEGIEKIPGIYLTGNAYWGVGIPECIARGEKAAEQIAASFGDLHAR